ncbi:MAG: GNAT family N-acetyltransferase [Candidatus Latescibacterota bacterium]
MSGGAPTHQRDDNMEVVIKELSEIEVADVGKCDGVFIVDSRLVVDVENNEVRYEIVGVPCFKKRYGEDDVDYATYVDSPDKTVFLAYVNGQVAGQIILRRNWNRYACIEDIAVDVGFRRTGIGTALIAQATRWARERNLPGIMLETQDNNVGACRFYECCGFKLRGFDTQLYRGIDSGTDEIALYWYLVFETGSAHQVDGDDQDTKVPVPFT